MDLEYVDPRVKGLDVLARRITATVVVQESTSAVQLCCSLVAESHRVAARG